MRVGLQAKNVCSTWKPTADAKSAGLKMKKRSANTKTAWHKAIREQETAKELQRKCAIFLDILDAQPKNKKFALSKP